MFEMFFQSIVLDTFCINYC